MIIRVKNEKIGKRYFCNFAASNRKSVNNLCKILIIKQLGGAKSPLQTFAYPLSKAGPMGSVLDFFVPECEMKLRIKRIMRMSCLNTAAKAANVYEFGLGHSYPCATKLQNSICKDSSYSCHS